MIKNHARPPFAQAKRIVIKLGTRVLTDPNGELAVGRLHGFMKQIAALRSRGTEVLLVSSGAVGLGATRLGMEPPIQGIADRQAAAAVGQSQLMALYSQGFQTLGIEVGQVLLTHKDFEDRARYLNIRNTFLSLLRNGALPIINENDAVSIAELQDMGVTEPVFGDNDKLSAVVASKLGADLLILLTDVPGLYDKDPSQHPDATLITCVEDQYFEASKPNSSVGRGGMRTKVEAAHIAVRAGCHAIIASGIESDDLEGIFNDEERGSWFPARTGMSAKHRWIAWGSPAKGILQLDSGAIQALEERGASLLAKGVLSIEGSFGRGDVVELRSETNEVVGRGMISCDAHAATAWVAGTAPAAARNHHALVHRDHLVLETS